MREEMQHDDTSDVTWVLGAHSDWCDNNLVSVTKSPHPASERAIRTGEGVDMLLQLCRLVAARGQSSKDHGIKHGLGVCTGLVKGTISF